MSWEGLNRRKFPRAKFPCLVKISSVDGAGEALLAHTENISTGGICVILKKGIELFTPVNITIDLMNSEDHIQCHGRVVWIVRRKAIDAYKPSYYDTGLEYVDIKELDRKRVEAVVEHLVKGERKSK